MNAGVIAFFRHVARDKNDLYLSVVTVGALHRGVELIRHRGDEKQATQLETWLSTLLDEYEQSILPFNREEAQV